MGRVCTMGNQILAVFIICVPFLAKGFPLSDTFNEVLEPRDIISDYVTSWFWSPASIEEPSKDDSKVAEKSNVQLDEKAEDDRNTKNVSIDPTLEQLEDFSIPGKIKPLQKISSSVQTEDLEDLMETIKEEVKDSNNEEKLGTFNFLQKLKATITTNPAPYVEVVYKKVKHFISIGTLGDSKRVRCFGSFGTPWWLGLIQMFYGLFGMLGQQARTGATNQVGLNNNWLAGLFGMNPALQQAQGQVQLNSAPPSQLNLFGQIDPNSQTFSRTINPNASFQGGNPFGNLTGLLAQQNPSQDNISILMLLLLLANQVKGNPNTPNNDIMKIIMQLQGNRNPNNSNIDISKILTSLQGNPSNNSNTDIMKLLAPLLGKSITNPNSEISIKDQIPRLFIVNDNPEDLNLDFNDSMKIYQITGSPEERLKKIRANYLGNPDASQKAILIDEINRLINETDRNSTLYPKIIEFYNKMKLDPRFKTAISIDPSNGGRGPRSFENIVFLDDNGNRIARESLSDDFVQRILKRISGSVKDNQIRTFNNPEALRKFYSDINLHSL